MPIGYCTLRCIPEPFSFQALNTPTTSGAVEDPVIVIWDDGATDAWASAQPAAILPATSYGTATFDTTLFAWLLVAVKGTSAPVVIKEMDQATIDTVIGGTPTRAVIRRIADGMHYSIPQV